MALALVFVKTPAIENPRKIRIGDVVRIARREQVYIFGKWLNPVVEARVTHCARRYFRANGVLFDRKTGREQYGDKVISKVAA